METALAIACKKNFGEASVSGGENQPRKIFHSCVYQQNGCGRGCRAGKSISLDDAREIKKSYKLGDEVLTELDPRTFGRIAAQNARRNHQQPASRKGRNVQSVCR